MKINWGGALRAARGGTKGANQWYGVRFAQTFVGCLDLTKVWVNFRSSVVLRFSTKVLNALLLVESQNELWGFGFRAPWDHKP